MQHLPHSVPTANVHHRVPLPYIRWKTDAQPYHRCLCTSPPLGVGCIGVDRTYRCVRFTDAALPPYVDLCTNIYGSSTLEKVASEKVESRLDPTA